MGSRIACIIAGHNGAGHLPTCIGSLLEGQGEQPDVLVVDNDSSDSTVSIACDAGARVLRAGVNRGYGSAINLGLRCTTSEYVVAMNQDVVVEPLALPTLLMTLEAERSLGREVLVGPALRDSKGSLAETAHRLPSLASSIVSLLMSERLAGDRNSRDSKRKGGSEEWVSAAFIMARRSTWEKLNGFDERYFMYVEDVDLFERARKLNIYCRWDPSASVVHASRAEPWPERLYAAALCNWVFYWRTRRRWAGELVWLAAWIGAVQRGVSYMAPSRRGQSWDQRRKYARMFFRAGVQVLLWGPRTGGNPSRDK